MSELSGMAKMFGQRKTTTTKTFMKDWKPYMSFLLKKEIHDMMIYGFQDEERCELKEGLVQYLKWRRGNKIVIIY